MNITTTGINMELTPAIQDYAEKRIAKGIVKYVTEAGVVAITVGKTTNHHKNGDVFIAEANIETPLGKVYNAVSEKSDLYEAIDDLRDTLVRELSSSKDKKEALWKRGARTIKNLVRRS